MPLDSRLSTLDSYRRDPALRERYLSEALRAIPRLLSAIDRNPYRKTYGCLDRQFWHYCTAAFPSEMYQEGVLPLALVYATPLPGNRWLGDARVKELAVAGMHFAAASTHADGSCDDYYPFERALGAAVFSLAAAARAYQVLELSDARLCDWFDRRAAWLMANDESGRLANHQALAALGLWRVADITGKQCYRLAAEKRIETVLAWQDEEGWFNEYGGADPGYQTVTIDCLAKIAKEVESRESRVESQKGNAESGKKEEAGGATTGRGFMGDESLGRAVDFASLFLHPDESYGGPYGSRGTSHFYPHGMELLAAENPKAADLADGFLAGLAKGSVARLDDDRMFAHRLANLIEAYVDWTPEVKSRESRVESREEEAESGERREGALSHTADVHWLPHAGMLVHRMGRNHTIVSAARGGSFVHFDADGKATADAGLIVETTDGRIAVSHCHERSQESSVESREEEAGGATAGRGFMVARPLCWTRFETATPWKQAVFHVGMMTVGRWCRTAVRRLLQQRLITARRECPVQLTRRFEFLEDESQRVRLRVTDTIELCGRHAAGVRVRRMALGSDHESAYVAAGNVYQPSLFTAWTDLAAHVETLNTERKVTVVREF